MTAALPRTRRGAATSWAQFLLMGFLLARHGEAFGVVGKAPRQMTSHPASLQVAPSVTSLSEAPTLSHLSQEAEAVLRDFLPEAELESLLEHHGHFLLSMDETLLRDRIHNLGLVFTPANATSVFQREPQVLLLEEHRLNQTVAERQMQLRRLLPTCRPARMLIKVRRSEVTEREKFRGFEAFPAKPF